MPTGKPHTTISLADRVAGAFVSGAAALATCAVVGIAILIRGGPWEVEFWSRAFHGSALVSAGAAILGFTVGPERMANAFGIVWGTAEPNAWRAALLLAAALAVVAMFFWR